MSIIPVSLDPLTSALDQPLLPFRRMGSKNIHGLVFFLIGLLVLSFGLKRVTYNVDVLALLPPELPEVKGMSALYTHFSRVTELIVTLETTDPAASEAAVASLAAAFSEAKDQVSHVIWRLPLEDDPEFAAEFLAYMWLNAEPDAVAALNAKIAPGKSSARFDAIIDDLGGGLIDKDLMMRTYDPLGFTELPGGLESNSLLSGSGNADPFTSEDGTFRMLYVNAAAEDFENYTGIIAWIDQLESVIETWRQKFLEEYPDFADVDLSIGITGKPSFIAEVSSGMERDMRGSMAFTSIFIFILFWIIHRRIKPLLWLVSMLVLITGGTLLIASTLIGELSVMSIGFAAILIGLTVDYGVVLYKEAHVAPNDPKSLRRIIGPSVVWAAITTGVVFFALNFSSLPGVAQLGTLVTTGVIVGATVMLIFFSPVAARYGHLDDKQRRDQDSDRNSAPHRRADRLAMIVTVILLASAGVTLLVDGRPEMASDFRPMRLRNSPSLEAYDRAKEKIKGFDEGAEPLVVTAANPTQLAERLDAVEARMTGAEKTADIEDFHLPINVIPDPRHQSTNRSALKDLLGQRERLLTEIDAAGFSEDAAALANGIFKNWQSYLDSPPASANSVITPSNPIGNWVVQRFVSLEPIDGEIAALGNITASKEIRADHGKLRRWAVEQSNEENGVRIADWSTLTVAIHELIRGDFVRVFLPMGLLLVIMLAIVFRNWRDVMLALLTLTFSGVMVMMMTLWFGFSWNFFNITALPILFGTGIDYSIHMIFALRRTDGDLTAVRSGISKAILFCAGSTAVGFGSLSLAANQGLSSLGQVCGVGIMANMLAALLLLPHWWRIMHRKRVAQSSKV